MKITFYSTVDGENVINKTLIKGVTIPINLKRDVDILNPVLVLTNKTGVDYRKYNYCFIDTLNRFYFIRTVRQINGFLFHLELSCDVLETYKVKYYQVRLDLKEKCYQVIITMPI